MASNAFWAPLVVAAPEQIWLNFFPNENKKTLWRTTERGSPMLARFLVSPQTTKAIISRGLVILGIRASPAGGSWTSEPRRISPRRGSSIRAARRSAPYRLTKIFKFTPRFKRLHLRARSHHHAIRDGLGRFATSAGAAVCRWFTSSARPKTDLDAGFPRADDQETRPKAAQTANSKLPILNLIFTRCGQAMVEGRL